MKRNLKKLLILILCLSMAVLCPQKTFAIGALDTEHNCTLTLLNSMPVEKFEPGTEFRAYKIASLTFNAEIVVDELYRDIPVEVTETEVITVSDLLRNDAGQEVTETDFQKVADAIYTTMPTLSREPTAKAYLDESGNVSFNSLSTGIYLIDGGICVTKTKAFVTRVALVSLPMRTEDDQWNYDVQGYIKFGIITLRDPIDIKVIKEWTDITSNLHEKDQISANLYCNGELFDTQILNKANNWTYTWRSLPGMLKWTVTEQPMEGYTGVVKKAEDNTYVITNKPSDPPDDPPDLPVTGYFWWPVLLIFGLGLTFVLLGFYLRKRGRRNEAAE